MLRARAVRAVAAVSAILVVAIAWYLGSPLFIRTTANEALPTASAPTSSPFGDHGLIAPATPSPERSRVLARGELGYVDALHNGKGAVMLVGLGSQRFLRFEDVAITNAPDVHVYLSPETGGKWTEATSLYLGPLKATNGSFNYEIAAGIDLAPYRSVVVWCRAFAVLVTWADLVRV